MLDCQELLAACKVITSKQYHAAHHFHNEMSYPAILMPVNEYLNAKSLTPFLTRTMDGKRLAQVEKLLTAMQERLKASHGLPAAAGPRRRGATLIVLGVL